MSTASTVYACAPSKTPAVMSGVVCIVQVSSRYCHHYLSTGMACLQVLMSGPAVHKLHTTHVSNKCLKAQCNSYVAICMQSSQQLQQQKQEAFAKYCKKEPQSFLLLDGPHCHTGMQTLQCRWTQQACHVRSFLQGKSLSNDSLQFSCAQQSGYFLHHASICLDKAQVVLRT